MSFSSSVGMIVSHPSSMLCYAIRFAVTILMAHSYDDCAITKPLRWPSTLDTIRMAHSYDDFAITHLSNTYTTYLSTAPPVPPSVKQVVVENIKLIRGSHHAEEELLAKIDRCLHLRL